MRWWICIIVLGLHASLCSEQALGDASGLQESAKLIAGRIARQLSSESGKPEIAVFPFSNSEGNISPEMGELPIFLQGEIIHWLTHESGNQFFVLNKAALARRIKSRGVSPTRIDPSDRRGVASALKKAGIAFAVLGSLDGVLESELTDWRDVKISAAVYSDEGNATQLVGSIGPEEIHDHVASGAGVPRFEKGRRLKTEILLSGQPLPLLQCRNPESPFCGALFLELPKTALGREYQIRITNRGKPGIDSLKPMGEDGPYAGTSYESEYDPQRLIGIAVYVDGVSTLFEKTDNGDYEPVVREPRRVSKWLLTPPGSVLRQQDTQERWDDGSLRINNGRIRDAEGLGNSRLFLQGFQVSNEVAQSFVFSEAEESLAEMIGITKEIGIISVYVFPEYVPEEEALTTIYKRLPGGKLVAECRAATTAGRPLPSRVEGFRVSLVEEPRQVWRIYYRLKGDELPVPRSDLEPFYQ